MREVEDRIERKLYRQGKILGGVYVGRGQEAIPVGTGLAAQPDDVLFPSHRDMAVFLVRGVHPRQVFAQYMGRVGGLTRGKDGNMHMGDMRLNVVAIISAMAACVPVAAGAALAMKYRGRPDVALCYFGDGATSRGDWHEGINWPPSRSSRWCWSATTTLRLLHAPRKGDGLRQRGRPRPGIRHSRRNRGRQRRFRGVRGRPPRHGPCPRRHGPYLLECKTFRMTGHSAHDPADYVPKHLFEEWAKKDPILRLEKLMLEREWAGRAALDRVHAQVRREVDEAVEWAEKSPYPDPSELLDHVYDEA
jgi:TPP-dependent pyruvate/acetoin dehydrogenase alpha subunit